MEKVYISENVPENYKITATDRTNYVAEFNIACIQTGRNQESTRKIRLFDPAVAGRRKAAVEA